MTAKDVFKRTMTTGILLMVFSFAMALATIGCANRQEQQDPAIESVSIDPTLNTEPGACFRVDPEHSCHYPSSGILPEGKIKWRLPGRDRVQFASVSEGIIVSGQAGYTHVIALDSDSGKIRWTFRTEDEVRTYPAIAGGMAFFGSSDNNFYAVDLYSGEERWRFEAGEAVESSPVLVAGIVYFGCDDGNFYALNALSGEEIWRFKSRRLIRSSPALSCGIVFFANEGGKLYALDAATGEEKWSYQIFPSDTQGYIDRGVSPAVADGIVYIGSRDDNFYAITASTGELVWKAAGLEYFTLAPTIDNGCIYVCLEDSGFFVVSLDQKTGEEILRYQMETMNFIAPPIADGRLYYTSAEVIFCVDGATGEEIWSTTNSPFAIYPIVYKGVVYTGYDAFE